LASNFVRPDPHRKNVKFGLVKFRAEFVSGSSDALLLEQGGVAASLCSGGMTGLWRSVFLTAASKKQLA